MDFNKSFKQKLGLINIENFEEAALSLFRHQSRHNLIYNSYLSLLKIDSGAIDSIEKIPFLPIEFFKTSVIKSGAWEEHLIFESSGTTGHIPSRNYVRDPEFYQKTAISIFESIYGPIEEFTILALLPSYLERANASLVFMVEAFIKRSGSSLSGFFLDDTDLLAENLQKASKSNSKVLLIGVTFALLDFSELYKMNLKNVIVMETGGMKGRREELLRSEVHQILQDRFGVPAVHSEFGMTELTSQAYALREGEFMGPPWMKILIRDVNDPFSFIGPGKTGGINIIDLSNVDTCAFIETQDMGLNDELGYFEVLGRLDQASIRGCNLLVS